MSNDVNEQPSCDNSMSADMGSSDVASPRQAPSEAPAKVPLPGKEEDVPKRRAPRTVRVKKKPVEEPPAPKHSNETIVADPMFFAGLNTTLKMMVQRERQHRLSSMAIV